ncbi:hypothetical protein V9K67_19080 [Paraflavisolibacter sp. H34]|uniref:hypothetical protein n=1 Tax=Huijunlia imazamoxiresistens TaxID=3127457 RepID=UPI00301AC0FE
MNEKNVANEKWIKNNFPLAEESANFKDTTHLRVRISSKKGMLGFLKPSNLDPNGAFGKLIAILSRFYATPHNPKTKTTYAFFNGDAGGKITETVTDPGALFVPAHYTAVQDNLNFQFRAITDEINKGKASDKTFHILLCDGETTIRRYKNYNTTEFSQIQDAVKDLLSKQPGVCIGVISLLANFDGPYNYEIDAVKNVTCKRYLYAFCFFDKAFIPEFQRFAEEAASLQGRAFLFNPKVPAALVSTGYRVVPKKLGATNKSAHDYFAAYSFLRNTPDSIVAQNTISHFKGISLPALEYTVYYHKPQKDFKVAQEGKKEGSGVCTVDNARSSFAAALALPKDKIKPGVYRLETAPNYNAPVNKITGFDIESQNIDDNTLNEVTAVKSDGILKTEGLKDLYEVIIKAMVDIEQPPFYNNYLTINKE